MLTLPFSGIFLFTGKTVTPKSVSDLKLIHAGKVLENNKTLADYRITFGEIPGGVVTMHVVVQPPVTKKKTGMLNLFICTFARVYRLHGYVCSIFSPVLVLKRISCIHMGWTMGSPILVLVKGIIQFLKTKTSVRKDHFL